MVEVSCFTIHPFCARVSYLWHCSKVISTWLSLIVYLGCCCCCCDSPIDPMSETSDVSEYYAIPNKKPFTKKSRLSITCDPEAGDHEMYERRHKCLESFEQSPKHDQFHIENYTPLRVKNHYLPKVHSLRKQYSTDSASA